MALINAENLVVKILMGRDGVSLEDAIESVEACRDAIWEAEESCEDVEEVIMEQLGLEPDYLFDII